MEEIRKIPSPLQNPQPVGGSRPNRPDEKTGDEFKEVLRRRRERRQESEDVAALLKSSGHEEVRAERSRIASRVSKHARATRSSGSPILLRRASAPAR